jgi:hypothetical protein
MEQAKDNAYESAQKAKEAAQKAYEAAKEGAAGFGERLIDYFDYIDFVRFLVCPTQAGPPEKQLHRSGKKYPILLVRKIRKKDRKTNF